MDHANPIRIRRSENGSEDLKMDEKICKWTRRSDIESEDLILNLKI